MHRHDEIELKWAVDADGYRRLEECIGGMLGAPRVLSQRNRFFDSADRRLRRAGLNMRLRQENDRLVLTCKRKSTAQAGGLHRHDEWETEVAMPAWDDADSLRGMLPSPQREALGDAALMPLGGFANHRLEWHDGPHLLCLDRTTFSAERIDHELEIETADPAAAGATWSAHLARWGIAYAPQPATKFARFIACCGNGGAP